MFNCYRNESLLDQRGLMRWCAARARRPAFRDERPHHFHQLGRLEPLDCPVRRQCITQLLPARCKPTKKNNTQIGTAVAFFFFSPKKATAVPY